MIEGIDYGFSVAVQSFSSPMLDILFRLISFFGNPIFWLVIASFFYWSGREKKGIFLINLVVIVSASVAAFKSLFSAPRPSGIRVVEENLLPRQFSYDPIDYSFPSGHSAMVSSAFIWLRKDLKRPLFLVALMPVAVALSRIYLGKHWLSDVIAGLFLGLLLGIINERLSARFEKVEFNLKKISSEIVAALIVFCLLIALLFADIPLMAFAVAGFYVGFFISRAIGINQPKLGGKNALIKIALGFAGLLAICTLALAFSGASWLICIIAGIWISLIFPYIYEKIRR